MISAYFPNRRLYFEQVWELVRQVPYGRVVSYGQIAQSTAKPEGVTDDDYRVYSARWVGLAMAACPNDVPWQRVVNSQGRISRQSEARVQIQLLTAEGIVVTDDRLDLKVYQWRGPDQSDEYQQGSLF